MPHEIQNGSGALRVRTRNGNNLVGAHRIDAARRGSTLTLCMPSQNTKDPMPSKSDLQGRDFTSGKCHLSVSGRAKILTHLRQQTRISNNPVALAVTVA